MTNPVLEANQAAWERFCEEQTAPNDRETFDNGWDAALEYAESVHHAERHQLTLLVQQQATLIEALKSVYRGR